MREPGRRRTRQRARSAVVLVAALVLAACSESAVERSLAPTNRAEELDQAIAELVAMPGGPPGAIVVVQDGEERTVHAAGVADVETGALPKVDDHLRVASVAKAFSGRRRWRWSTRACCRSTTPSANDSRTSPRSGAR
jgi:D-alanyl-D-alanine carboxypeptidase